MGNCCSSCSKAVLRKSAGYQEIPSQSSSHELVETSVQTSEKIRTDATSTPPRKRVEFSDNSASMYAAYNQPSKSGFFIKYELGEEIGSGSTSKCYRCTRKSDGKVFACKIIDKKHIENNFNSLLDQCLVEIKVLQSVDHPNIIHLEDNFETPDRIYMVLELMQGGELFDYVVQKGTLSEEEAAVLVRKVTSAIATLHSMNIIHRDLKPENLLLTSKESDAEVKLIDFGLAKIMDDNVAKSFLGTRGYLAPEMLQRHAYDKAVDIWALGVIVFVLLCGCLPFDDDSSKINSETVARKKFTLRFPRWAANLSASAKDLLHNLLDVNPKTRFTAEQALNHPWVNGRTVQPNNYLQSPSLIGERRRELRSPANPHIQAVQNSRRMNGNNGNNGNGDGESFNNNYYDNNGSGNQGNRSNKSGTIQANQRQQQQRSAATTVGNNSNNNSQDSAPYVRKNSI